ncbi:MAG: exo-alpha-sialidase [Phycisphaerales bacterium]|nr:exo-alpha-sialidase [Phycisphaerales bacterium]
MVKTNVAIVLCMGLLGSVIVESGAAKKSQKYALAKYKGFSIPQIDLNDRADLQIVISKDPKIYMGHPSSVLLDDGKTIVMMYLNQHGRGRLMWRRSVDAGKTWSKHLPLPEGWDEPVVIKGKKYSPFLEVPILYKVTDAKGKQRIVLYTAGRNIYPARYAVSVDGGKTWSRLKPILFGGKELQNTIVFLSDLIRLKNGSYMGTWHYKGITYVATTSDGLSFSEPRIAAQYPKAFPCEGCLIRSPDGKKIALLLRENNRVYNSLICFSSDEGKTWTKPRQMPDSLTGDRHQHTYTPDGRLFISFRDRGVKTKTYGDWVAWVGTFEDLEESREGQYRIRMKDNLRGADCAYPTQHIFPDGTIFAATYGQWGKGEKNSILGYRFKIGQLDAMAKKVGTVK